MQSAANPALSEFPPALYIHFPWCVKKCPYCDFNSHPISSQASQGRYLDALQEDLAASLASADPQLASVFCGGGTPSLFGPDVFATLLDEIKPWLAADAEITMEANPGTLEHQDLGDYRRAGINRLSLGAQSFNALHLDALGRIHSPGDIRTSFANARRGRFDNINLDIMYALPGQSPQQAEADLSQALELEPDHISWYQLTIEAKTEFAKRPPTLPNASDVAEMEARGLALLASRGYERYEVSAFARPDKQCLHNVNYWRFGDYLGAGAGAHGKLTQQGRIVRTRKATQPRLYMNDPLETIAEPVPADQVVVEFMLNALRLQQGVSFQEFFRRTGLDESAISPVWESLAEDGLVEHHRIATTPMGFAYIDSIIQRFLT